MATYFLNCSDNLENFNLCLQNNAAGFPSSGYETGSLVYLIVKEKGKWKLGARELLGEISQNKPGLTLRDINQLLKLTGNLQ